MEAHERDPKVMSQSWTGHETRATTGRLWLGLSSQPPEVLWVLGNTTGAGEYYPILSALPAASLERDCLLGTIAWPQADKPPRRYGCLGPFWVFPCAGLVLGSKAQVPQGYGCHFSRPRHSLSGLGREQWSQTAESNLFCMVGLLHKIFST